MTTRLADAEGRVTDAAIAYYRARAAGGVGLITVEMASPEPVERHRHRELGIYDDRFLPGLERLVAEVQACGAKASIQLGHGGGHTREDVCGEPPIAPSAVPHSVYEVTNRTVVPVAMTKARIDQTTQAFVDAARRAGQAGFDCVEVHAAPVRPRRRSPTLSRRPCPRVRLDRGGRRPGRIARRLQELPLTGGW